MSGTKAQEHASIMLESLARTGQRGLAGKRLGWVESDLPVNVFMLERAPHDWLFPRVSAVVHHGGDGTTAAR